jgi:4-hydroxy-3-methylbut-2-enyl diphosphate reductase IspH
MGNTRLGPGLVAVLDGVPDGAVTIFSAHGVPQSVATDVAARGLPVLDATCPLASKIHSQCKRYVALGRTPPISAMPPGTGRRPSASFARSPTS